MLVDEKPMSFVKRNNSYSHCPLKKRPVHVMLAEEIPETCKEEPVDIVVDEIPEPENLSTKPEDLSLTAEKLKIISGSPNHVVRCPSPISRTSLHLLSSPSHLTRRRSPSPPRLPLTPMSLAPSAVIHHIHHSLNYPLKTVTPPTSQQHQHQHQHQQHANPTSAPVHPVAKKARVEVLQHENVQPIRFASSNTTSSNPTSLNTPENNNNNTTNSVTASTTAAAPLESLNLTSPLEPMARYATPAWARTAPIFPPHYLPYPAAYRYPPTELYPAYPVPAYSHSSPEHPSVSPPPHASLTCPTIQRPVARSYAPWSSPDHCGLSPTSSLGSGSLRSPPPVTPEDLSSPGSDSGRSSAGSTSAGPVVNQKSEKSSTSPRYQCPDCGKSYSTYSGLSKHQQFHCAAAEGQTKKSFSCKYCEKVYVSLGALKMHIRTHTLPCKCHLCGKAFSRPWLLQGHIRTHTGEKPFSCQHCNRAFADRSNLRAHLQTHSDVKKYSCLSCSKTFSRMSLLTKHQEGGCPGVAVPMAYGC